MSIQKPEVLRLRLSYAEDKQQSRLELHLENTLDIELRQWCLHLDLQRDVCAGTATAMTRTGSHLRLSPVTPCPLLPGDDCRLQLTGAPRLLQRLSDLPGGCYLSTAEDVYEVQLQAHHLPLSRPENPPNPDGSREQPARSGLLPAARYVTATDGWRPWPVAPGISAAAAALPALDWLQSMLGCHWQSPDNGEQAELVCAVDATLAEEAYRLDINGDRILLEAATAAGFCRGAASLLQLREGQSGEYLLPCLRVEDQPHYRYRALMLDCARHFHDLDTLFDLLDWMALYKLNHFHWHLTDDEAWRLDIKAYPQLREIGAWRGHREVLPPQLGSGPERYGGYYSHADVARVVDYAAARGITVVPEIDIPGHCRACIEALPGLLRDPDDRSAYCSVQFFDDNVLNPGLSGTYEFLDAVLAEVCELFPGPYVHLGADEVPAGVWLGSDACRRLMLREGYRDPRDLQGHLLGYAQRFLAARGRTLVGWEEAAQGDKLDRGTPICAWTGDEAVRQLVAAGYPVISCPAPRAYLDVAWSDDPGEPGLHWAGTADLEACYRQSPFPADVPNAMGVQANLWSELLPSREQLEYMLFPRVLATAEWGWSGQGGDNWPEFRARAERALDYLRSRGVRPRPLDPV
ncbi:beta-N-acetylhexosaminidase [Seongchinamella unica]|uniref:beta-N-acetylhexosaminidase n=1 Tax=Seongchinamella unica TaxID=2547392 RepID=UPI0014043DFB|nr:beta-N-acetylhexosaminidase [Seongchinamella unica]